MKILILSKRIYTNKDLVADRYGRVYELSRELARLGHQVRGVALDYRRRGGGHFSPAPDSNPEWQALPLFPGPLRGLRAYTRRLHELVDTFRPDVVLSVSDVYHVVLGDWLAARHGLRHVIDLYDNYESFGAARVPGMVGRYRRALRRADAISCVSDSLRDYVTRVAKPRHPPAVIVNAVDTGSFRPLGRDTCREQLGLPASGRVIGLGGSISEYRGAPAVFRAHQALLDAGCDVHLALAGAVADDTEVPESSRVHYLGELDYAQMPAFYNALDVGIVSNRDNAFSRYCFPQKFFELCACQCPVVVAAVGDVQTYMKDCGQGLFIPGDAAALERALRAQLEAPCIPNPELPDWAEQGRRLAALLDSVPGN